MRKILAAAMVAVVAAGAAAQTHKVAKTEDVLRAVGVYEWTGDVKKPAASRLIPVSLFVDGRFVDAGIYLARPVPMALYSGTVYELDEAGMAKGYIDLSYATHVHPADPGATSFDDGWVGFGVWRGVAEVKVAKLKEGSNAHVVKEGATVDDPDRPSLRRDKSVNSGAKKDAGAAPDAGKAPESAPAEDPDRPTLKKRSAKDADKDRKKDEDRATVSGAGGSLNDDPNRPSLHRGKPASAMKAGDLKEVMGVPLELKQMVAVSDAATRVPHDFSFHWSDDEQRKMLMAKMEAIAMKMMSVPKTMVAAPAGKGTVRGAKSNLRRGVSPPETGVGPVFLDERLTGYELSYGGAATFVYQAHTAGAGAELKYVTVVAQQNPLGDLDVALQTTTDAAHLDRTPWMRLVDAVDADSSNRASLLFELRGQSSRQFALYRVIAGQARQVFLSGSTQ